MFFDLLNFLREIIKVYKNLWIIVIKKCLSKEMEGKFQWKKNDKLSKF